MHEREFARRVRMGVFVRRRAVRRPARVPDARAAFQICVRKRIRAALFLAYADGVLIEYRHAHGVVAAVFQPFEPVVHAGPAIAPALHASDDSAHIR